MLDFHEGLGGWLAGCQAGWLACGDADLRVNKTHGHLDLHVHKGSRACRKGGDTDLRVNRTYEHLDLHLIHEVLRRAEKAGWLGDAWAEIRGRGRRFTCKHNARAFEFTRN